MYSSPFKETTSRAMLTVVGFLAKWYTFSDNLILNHSILLIKKKFQK